MPHTLRRVDVGEEALAELGVLMGFDDDRTPRRPGSATASAGCSPRSTPPPSGVVSPKVPTTVVVELLAPFGGPAGLRAAGRRWLLTVAR